MGLSECAVSRDNKAFYNRRSAESMENMNRKTREIFKLFGRSDRVEEARVMKAIKHRLRLRTGFLAFLPGT
jgi:hypothetical protein